MQTLNANSQNKIYLEVYSNGQLVQADTLPTLNIYNADNDTFSAGGALSQSALYSNLTAYNENSIGVYSFTLTPSMTRNNIVFEVVWSYLQGGVSSVQTDFYSVETPYASVSQTIDFLGFSAVNSDSNYLSQDIVVKCEKMARTIIDGYTGIKFGRYYGGQEVRGIGADAIELTEKMLSLDQVYENESLVYDATVTPVYNNFSGSVVISPSGKQIRVWNAVDQNYDNVFDSVLPNYKRFRNGSLYRFVGEIGYKYIPEDIKLASMLLQKDIMAQDYDWRNKYLSEVTLSEITLKMAKGAFNGTGNVLVDNILDEYRSQNIMII